MIVIAKLLEFGIVENNIEFELSSILLIETIGGDIFLVVKKFSTIVLADVSREVLKT